MENLAIVLITVAVLLVAAFIIPVLLQLQRTAKSMSKTLQLLNASLPGILKNLEEITANANRATKIVTREVEELSLTLRKVQGTLSLLLGVEEVVRRNLHLAFSKRVRTSIAVVKGVRVFLDYLLSRRRPETDCR